jgi:hypothetical protein
LLLSCNERIFVVKENDHVVKANIKNNELLQRKMEKFKNYVNYKKILVIESIYISAPSKSEINCSPFNLFKKVLNINNDVDYIFFILTGQKNPNYFLELIPIYLWNKYDNNKIMSYTFSKCKDNIIVEASYDFSV